MKISTRITLLAATGALVTGVLAPSAQASDPPREPTPTPVTQPTSGDRFERLHLACRKVEGSKVRCEWRAPTGENAVKVVLFGSVNDGGRIVLKALRPPAAGSYTRTIPRGARKLDFVLVTFNSLGKVVGRSAVITIIV